MMIYKYYLLKKKYFRFSIKYYRWRYNEQSFRLNNNELHNHNIMYLIEGNLQIHRPYSKINKKTIYSSMVTLNYYKGFSVMRSMNIQETADMVIKYLIRL